MFRVMFALLSLLMLAGCIESELEKSQKTHIDQYYQHIREVLGNYTKDIAKDNSPENVYNIHLEALESFANKKQHFEQFKEEERLQVVIDIYDYALSNLLLRQAQVFELAQPLWHSNTNKLEKIKDPTYYKLHQEKLSELIVVLGEYQELMLGHRENVRKKIVASGLEKEQREQIWPGLNNLISVYLNGVKSRFNSVKKLAETEVALVQFLYEHRDDYVVSEANELQFKTTGALDAYRDKVRYFQSL